MSKHSLCALLALAFLATIALPLGLRAEPVNLALNIAASGFPSPLESDPGWGGGSYPWEIVDGLHSYSAWYHGLAFWYGPTGQATIDFGELTTFNEAIIWHHGVNYTPRDTWLDYWDGSAWMPITFDRLYGTMHEEGSGSGYADSDIYTFPTVTGTKIRYSSDNDGVNIVGGSMIHGWLYEFEVYNTVPEPAAVLLLTPALALLLGFRKRRSARM